MTKKQKIIIFSLVIIIFVVIIFIIFWILRKDNSVVNSPNNNTEKNTSLVNQLPNNFYDEGVKVIMKPSNNVVFDESSREKLNLETISSSFVERWGSFSNHSNYDNFSSLKVFMTVEMKKYTDSYLAKLKAEKANLSYYGLMTKALSAKAGAISGDKAEVIVVCQKEERTNIGAKILYAKITLSFVKEGGEWKVDKLRSEQ